MKVGTENRTKVIAAAALGTVAVGIIVSQFAGWFTGSSSSAAAPVTTSADFEKPATPSPRRTTRSRSRDAQSKQQSQARGLDPTLRLDLLKSSEDTKYEGSGRNIFTAFVEIPKVVVNPAKAQPQPVVDNRPPPPPPPPPSNLVFYGFATPQGGVKRIFLTKNEDVFIAKEGDIVDRRYKVVRITPTSVEILDVLSNNRENLPLRQG